MPPTQNSQFMTRHTTKNISNPPICIIVCLSIADESTNPSSSSCVMEVMDLVTALGFSYTEQMFSETDQSYMCAVSPYHSSLCNLSIKM